MEKDERDFTQTIPEDHLICYRCRAVVNLADVPYVCTCGTLLLVEISPKTTLEDFGKAAAKALEAGIDPQLIGQRLRSYQMTLRQVWDEGGQLHWFPALEIWDSAESEPRVMSLRMSGELTAWLTYGPHLPDPD